MPGHDPDLNMKYDSVEDMLKTILQSTDLLSESVETLKKIATKIDNGAFQSKQGQQLSDSIRNRVTKRVMDSHENLTELGNKLRQSMDDFREADSSKS